MAGHPNDTANPIPSLSLIIPAFNEEAVIRQAIAEAADALSRLGGEYEILVVDDGSTDNTAALVAESVKRYPNVRLLRHAQNRGYGAALRTGFEAARFDHVAFTDADCQFDLADLASFRVLAERFPLVVGYRQDRQDPALRRFASWGYNHLVRTLLGTRVRDCDCALKVFQKNALANLLPETGGFFVNTEMLTRARQLDYGVAEVAVRHRPRLGGKSKVSLGDIPRTLRVLFPFWWTRLLFPGAVPAAEHVSSPGPRSHAAVLRLAILLLAAGLLFFARLRCPLLEPEESRYAEIPRQMLEENSFLIPILHGQPYLHKPPLLYWLVMGSYTLFGVHDWAARLVPCGAGFLIVLVTYLWGRHLAGERAGFAGAAILCLTARFIYFGRMLTFESLLCLWVICALAAAHLAICDGRLHRRWWLLSALCSGLGLLTKGPVALVLVAMPVLAYQLLDLRSSRPGVRSWLGYATVAAIVACPWYFLVAARDAHFAGSFFWTHNVVRYLAPFDHVKPVWFYLPGFLLGMMPWTLLLPPFVHFLGRRSGKLARLRSSAMGFFLLSAFTSLGFFSASGCKRAGYILPVFPPLALALGCFLAAVVSPSVAVLGNQAFQKARQALCVWCYRATALVLALGSTASVVAWVAGIWKVGQGMCLAGIAATGLACVVRYGRSWSIRTSWGLCGGITFALLLIGVHQLLPGYARRFSLRGQVRRHYQLAQNPQLAVACYPHRYSGVSFYLQRRDVRVYTPQGRRQMITDLQAQANTLVFLKSDRPAGQFCSDLLRRLPSSLEFVPKGRCGTVTAGIIRRRSRPAEFLVAEK